MLFGFASFVRCQQYHQKGVNGLEFVRWDSRNLSEFACLFLLQKGSAPDGIGNGIIGLLFLLFGSVFGAVVRWTADVCSMPRTM